MADIRDLGKEILNWRSMRQEIEASGAEDEFSIIEKLEKSTNVNQILLEIEQEIEERSSYLIAIDFRIKELTERKSRHEKAIDKMRQVILNVMDNLGLNKIEGPECTLSVSNLKPELYVENESEIPARFWIPQEPKLDKKKLREELEAGVIDLGASLGNGKIGLKIRRK